MIMYKAAKVIEKGLSPADTEQLFFKYLTIYQPINYFQR
ncbi:hypothetical protein STSP1_01747 [Sedimentisphaera salicampi]|uniref:Uncharacterized protein n=1 Tax=Sedimentisphaera salicampi TaxID=1941349 RepID=A0A1W6LNN1_9BACT|nr:hypothetical protein STSP1_01747 [Sedimentisphaera salicampi]